MNKEITKKIAVVFGLHGDERTSVAIAALLKQSQSPDIDLFGPVNLPGLYANTRHNPQDGQDMNRFQLNGPSISDHEMTLLHKTLLNYPLIIDLHNLVGQNTIATGSVIKPFQTIESVGKYYAKLGITFLDIIDTDEEPAYKTTLSGHLLDSQKITLIIELPDILFVNNDYIASFAQSIVMFAKSFKNNEILESKEARVYRHIEQLFSPEDGVVVANNNVNPGMIVKRGDNLGTFYGVSGENMNLNASEVGILQNFSTQRFVTKNTMLFNIVH